MLVKLPTTSHEHIALQCLDIANKGDEPDTVMSEMKNYEISADRKKMLIRKAMTSTSSTPKRRAHRSPIRRRWQDRQSISRVGLISTNPRDEFRGIFLDAWRLERDFFYDPNMHGVNWPSMRDRYLPLVDRVADRDELNDVIAQMVGELSALHTFVFGGDERKPADQVDLPHWVLAFAAMRKPAASSLNISTPTILICPTRRRRCPALTPW